VGDGPKQPMTPLLETSFTGVGGRVEFGKNDKGEVTHIVFRIAGGRSSGGPEGGLKSAAG
jgi:hypothetical protein